MSHFFKLEPELVMSAVEAAGFEPTGEFSQLNSYENRVFEVKLETFERVIVKFYRPQRWSEAALRDEHQFLHELAAEGIKVVEPLRLKSQDTLLLFQGMYLSVFPKLRAKMPEELLPKDLVRVGKLLARIHNVGAQQRAQDRLFLDAETFGWNSLAVLQEWIAPELRERYNYAASSILEVFEDQIDSRSFIRIHGDAHRGNLLSTGDEFFMVDFDDFCHGPVVQDLWMLLSGDPENFEIERDSLLEGYEEFRRFPEEQWSWIPLLRGLRILHYSSWIARRWHDPSFPRLFPAYRDFTFWARETEALEQIAWTITDF
jgi:Ser/Thr protein kinase RdoA (MazF antagonist)